MINIASSSPGAVRTLSGPVIAMVNFLCKSIHLLITLHAVLLIHDRHRTDYDSLGNRLGQRWFNYMEDLLGRHVLLILPILWLLLLGLLLGCGLLVINNRLSVASSRASTSW